MPTRANLTVVRSAIDRGAWSDARDALAGIADREGHAEANELLGLVSWWLDDAATTFAARERAWTLYIADGDPLGAARVGIWLVWDNLAFRGDFAVASGWLERCRRILEPHQRSAEYGWLLVREGEVALFRGRDTRATIELARRAASLAREIGNQDVEFTALALEGLALVSSGEVADGMKRLDEASIAATAGEMKEMHAVGLVCCWQIFACERIRDYDRAAQWCGRVEEFSKRWGCTPLSATCRVHYAGVLIWRGDWAVAEQELLAAVRELGAARPAVVSGPRARLGELRLKQGRVDEAIALFDQAGSHPTAVSGRARIALERGQASEALTLLTQLRDQLGPTELTARAGLLELLIRAELAAGDLEGASRSLADLRHISGSLGTLPLAATALVAEGLLLEKHGDPTSAARVLDRAVTSFEQCGAPFETASARLDLARILLSAKRTADAERESMKAAAAFRSLGAMREEAKAKALARPSSSDDYSLTKRQIEILRLVAQGQSNPAIAKRLKLSEHTVKRHVANLLTRLDLPSRSAAVAYGAKKGLI